MTTPANSNTNSTSQLRTTSRTLDNNAVEVVFDGILPANPLDVWTGFTTRDATSAWIWPIQYEPGVGGGEAGLNGEEEAGVVTAWQPGEHFTTRSESADGTWFNQLDYRLTPTADGQTHLHYTHSTVFPEDFDNQLEACTLHTDLYNHSLGQYLQHFNGRAATATILDAPDASMTPDAYATLLRAIGINGAPSVGEQVSFTVPGIGQIDAVVDYATDTFLGLRGADALYRVYGRGRWGWPTGLSVHRLSPAGAAAPAEDATHDDAWQQWLNNVFSDAQ